MKAGNMNVLAVSLLLFVTFGLVSFALLARKSGDVERASSQKMDYFVYCNDGYIFQMNSEASKIKADSEAIAKDHGGLMTNAQITSYGAGTDDWHIDIRPKKSGPLVCSACGR